MRCVYSGNIEIAEYLLSVGAQVDACNSRYETPLYAASHRGFVNLVKILVEKYKANVNCRDKDGDTALSIACYVTNKEIAKYLLEHGANVSALLFAVTVILCPIDD